MKTKNIIIITSVVSVLVVALIISIFLSYSYVNRQVQQPNVKNQTTSISSDSFLDDYSAKPDIYYNEAKKSVSVNGLDDEVLYYTIPTTVPVNTKGKVDFDKYVSNQSQSPQEAVYLFNTDEEIVFDKNLDFKISGFQGRFFTTKYDGVEPLIVGLGNFKNKPTMIVISMRMDEIVSTQIADCTPKGGGLVDQACSKKNFEATFDYNKRIEQTQKLVIDAFVK